MKTELIIISYNTAELTLQCIESAYKYGGIDELEICVVDNASTDDTIESIRNKFPNVRIVENPENYGYAKACNIGAFSSEADFIVLSNSDIIFKQDSLLNLVKRLTEDERLGIVGPQQYYRDGSRQRSAGLAPSPGSVLVEHIGFEKLYSAFCQLVKMSPQYPDGYIDGAVLCIINEVYKELNGMDEDFFFYSEELDLCKRLRQKGYINETLLDSKVIHLRGGSGDRLSEKSVRMLLESKYKYLCKHYSEKAARKYSRSSYIAFQFKYSVFRFISKNRADNQKLFAKELKRIWKHGI
ncbi:MAG: glycosyltransferase family 2 protein [Candidatus Kapaibacteriales bacterium]